MATVKSSKQPEKPTLYVGTGTPYIALFDEASQPILNPLTNLPLGLYMDSFRYTFQEANSRSSRGFRKILTQVMKVNLSSEAKIQTP